MNNRYPPWEAVFLLGTPFHIRESPSILKCKLILSIPHFAGLPRPVLIYTPAHGLIACPSKSACGGRVGSNAQLVAPLASKIFVASSSNG